ncbi:MAG: hypothetical protein PH343_08345 [Nitrospira sp.]|nr:hypothetical protein [Nitrospira sp.]
MYFLTGGILLLNVDVYADGVGTPAYNQTTNEKGTYNDRTTKGFDPANIVCVDSNGNGWIDQGECSWGSTSTPWLPDPSMDTQKGSGVIPGGSSAALSQTSTTAVSEPHFALTYFNAPSAPSTTATTGVTSSSSAGLRTQHNEFGFEVVIDKKTDPLEPYYMKFSVPYTTVDSTQSDTTGSMTGNATGVYTKDVTEMDPNNPGVFNRYTVTGTYTSTGNSYSSSSGCTTGCTTDNEAQWRSTWP